MANKVAFAYLFIAGLLFLCGILFGKVLKKDVLHGGVSLGVINSALLSMAWPLTVIFMIFGWAYDIVQEWKKL
jgi:hypothetical protein